MGDVLTFKGLNKGIFDCEGRIGVDLAIIKKGQRDVVINDIEFITGGQRNLTRIVLTIRNTMKVLEGNIFCKCLKGF